MVASTAMTTWKAQKRCSGCYPSSPWQSSLDACTLRSVQSITYFSTIFYTTLRLLCPRTVVCFFRVFKNYFVFFPCIRELFCDIFVLVEQHVPGARHPHELAGGWRHTSGRKPQPHSHRSPSLLRSFHGSSSTSASLKLQPETVHASTNRQELF